MFCPNCKNELVIVEKDNVELDWCPVCNGLWFDAEEWGLLGINDESDNPFNVEAVKTDEKSKDCPICGKHMEKILINEVLLDRCPSRHGVWFDADELLQFVNNSKSIENNTVTTDKFLGEVFNIN